MNGMTGKIGFSTYAAAAFAALQWRLLLLWLLVLLMPTLVVTVPLAASLGSVWDHSVHVHEYAERFNLGVFTDVSKALAPAGAALNGAGVIALVLTLLLSPWLAGMAVASGRAARPLSFGLLIQGGCVEYGRMFRLTLWSLVPYAIALGVVVAAAHWGDQRTEQAVLESRADQTMNIVVLVAVLMFVLAQSIVESARAQFIADLGLRSATRALGRGVRQLVRRPLATLCVYLLVTASGLALALVVTLLRIRITPATGVTVAGAFLLVQLGVLVMAWMRTARLFSLGMVARTVLIGRRSSGTRAL
jgi:hypothetical protein